MTKQTPQTPEYEPFDEARYLALATAAEAQAEAQRWVDEDERARTIMEGLKPIAEIEEVEPVEGGTHIDISEVSEATSVEVHTDK